jgi:hypothetical protein
VTGDLKSDHSALCASKMLAARRQDACAPRCLRSVFSLY